MQAPNSPAVPPAPERVQIVCYTRGWIVEALARQWERALARTLPQARVRLVFGAPQPGDDTYLHFVYLSARVVAGARNIVYVTHVDRWAKALRLVALSRQGAEFVVLSRETRELVNRYLGGDVARCIRPESIHFASHSRASTPLTFGLFFKLYADGRKSPASIHRILRIASARPDVCRLVLMGQGWQAATREFPGLRAFVCEEFDKALYERCLARCDWVLYLGRDEGAMSVIDAAALGVPVLATSAGFHSDMSHAKGSQLFSSGEQVADAVERLCQAVQSHGGESSLASLFLSQPAHVTCAAFRRYLNVPLIPNTSILHRGNASEALMWIWRNVTGKRWQTREPLSRPGAGTVDMANVPGDDPQAAASHELRGLQLAGSGAHKLAILDFERACELEPQNAGLHLQLAIARVRCGDRAGADLSFARAISMDTRAPAFHWRFGMALGEAGHAAEAARHFDDALDMSLNFEPAGP